jgi:uncharacterized protein
MHTTPISGRRFGLTADTHDDKVDWSTVLAALKNAWGPVDAVLHCGDITRPGALEDLAGVAPVYATRSSGDPPAAAPTLADGPRVLEVGPLRIGLVFELPKDAIEPGGATRLFGAPVAACVFGGTHEASVADVDGVLFVNPGSPSLARTRTAAVLTLDDGRASAAIVEIG